MLRRAAAVLALLLCACGAPPREWPLPQAGLVLELPADWELQRAEGQTLLFARPLRGGTPVPSAYLQIVRHPQRQAAGADLASYARFSEEQAQRFALGYQQMESTPVQVAGHPGLRQLRRWQGHTRARTELAYLWVADGYGYQLSGAAEPAQFQALRARFERVALSLRAAS